MEGEEKGGGEWVDVKEKVRERRYERERERHASSNSLGNMREGKSKQQWYQRALCAF